MSADTLILDNGGYSIKAALADSNSAQLFPNCVSKARSERRRLFIADQLEECKDCSGLFMLLPLSKGVLTNYDTQRQIWDHVLRNRLQLRSDRSNRALNVIVTQPHFNFRQAQANLYELLYEEYSVDRLFTATPTCLASLNHVSSDQPTLDAFTGVLVDSGFSCTHVVPYVNGTKVKRNPATFNPFISWSDANRNLSSRSDAIVRVEVGGKAMTNHLKDLISYRQLHVLDETHVMNQCKEDCCFVSCNLTEDMAACKQRPSRLAVDYVLPDFVSLRRGYKCTPGTAKQQDQNLQTVRLNNERFQVPELLFYPSDVGLQQIGLSHAIHLSIEKIPEAHRPALYRNVILIGGNCNLPGLQERVQQDLRALAEHVFEVKVHLPERPETQAWLGGQRLATKFQDTFDRLSVSRQEYEESGYSRCAARFDI
jgi:actin-related protein 6